MYLINYPISRTWMSSNQNNLIYKTIASLVDNTYVLNRYVLVDNTYVLNRKLLWSTLSHAQNFLQERTY